MRQRLLILLIKWGTLHNSYNGYFKTPLNNKTNFILPLLLCWKEMGESGMCVSTWVQGEGLGGESLWGGIKEGLMYWLFGKRNTTTPSSVQASDPFFSLLLPPKISSTRSLSNSFPFPFSLPASTTAAGGGARQARQVGEGKSSACARCGRGRRAAWARATGERAAGMRAGERGVRCGGQGGARRVRATGSRTSSSKRTRNQNLIKGKPWIFLGLECTWASIIDSRPILD